MGVISGAVGRRNGMSCRTLLKRRHVDLQALPEFARSFSASAATRRDSNRQSGSGSQNKTNAIVSRAPTLQASGEQAAHSGPLQGWAVTIKDNICTTDMPTACASRMLEGYMSPFDATVVTLLREAGADIIGKTNCDEFGMGSANCNTIYGPVENPAAPDDGKHYVAGGSSGGAAASVASGEARFAIGTDTGGSVRLPSAFCGVYGLKPSYGVISRWGVVSYADSLDTVGLVARSVDDLEKVFGIVTHRDRKDPTSISESARSLAQSACDVFLSQASSESLKGIRIGVPQEYFAKEIHPRVLPAVRKALSRLRDAGAQILPVSMPETKYAFSAYYVLASAEASSNLARYDGVRYGYRAEPPSNASNFAEQIARTRSEGFGKEVQKRMLLGTYALTSGHFDNYYLHAQEVRQLVRRDFDAVFASLPNALGSNHAELHQNGGEFAHAEHDLADEGVHAILHPSAIDIAPTIEEMGKSGPQGYNQDLLTVPASLAGVPAVTAPMGRADGLPVGVTLATQWGCEPILWHLLRYLEDA